ncbi:MAG TPA: hypothetical protein VFK57_11395 [Vicinamibacterales bacterium]|nr:hypothetical protein [Vicinamibacterales bacterium]
MLMVSGVLEVLVLNGLEVLEARSASHSQPAWHSPGNPSTLSTFEHQHFQHL